MRRRLLFLYPQSLGPEADRERNAHYHLSSRFNGDLVYDWVRRPADRAHFLPLIESAIGDFRFHYDEDWRARERFGGWRAFRFYVSKALQLARTQGPYDAIVAYGPFRTGLAALLVSRLTGIPCIVEVPGNHLRSYDFYEGRWASLKRLIAKPVLQFVVKRADFLHLRYLTQLDELGGLPEGRYACFPNFIAVDSVDSTRAREKTVLFLGYPFHLKGVDVLIRGFLKVASRHPDWTLRIIGHCPDPSLYLELAQGHPRITIRRALPHPEAMEELSRCGVLVLPSRTEAAGRVLFEAMAARRPIIASRVDGSPYFVEHGLNGLLFESENVDDLAAQLDRLLSDDELAERMGAAGLERVHARYSMTAYVAQYVAMVEALLHRTRAVS